MKRIGSILMAAVLSVGLLAGCGASSNGNTDKTPEEWTSLYSTAITENGGEMVEYNPVMTEVDEEDALDAMVLETLGLTEEDMTAYAISLSMMNTQAYGIAAVMPAEGKEETVVTGLQTYIDRQKQSFETYLPDQKEQADNAKLETLSNGTVLLVMCEDQDTVFENIKTAMRADYTQTENRIKNSRSLDELRLFSVLSTGIWVCPLMM